MHIQIQVAPQSISARFSFNMFFLEQGDTAADAIFHLFIGLLIIWNLYPPAQPVVLLSNLFRDDRVLYRIDRGIAPADKRDYYSTFSSNKVFCADECVLPGCMAGFSKR
jgi:hypothetical protein